MSASRDILAPHPDTLQRMEPPTARRTTFRYFAYGSNLWTPRMVARCPSARIIGTALLEGWRQVYDKPSVDGSAKLNIRADPDGRVLGAVYEIAAAERERLDAAEPDYTPLMMAVGLTYAYTGEPTSAPPLRWYVDLVENGARSHGLEPPPTPAEVRPAASSSRPSTSTSPQPATTAEAGLLRGRRR